MTDILRRNRSPPPSPRSVRNIHIYTRDSRKQGVSSPYLGPPTSPHRSVSSIIEPVGKMQQKEDSSKLPGPAGRPPNALPTHVERGSNISTQRATCRHRRPRAACLPPCLPLLAFPAGIYQTGSQGTGPWNSGFRYLAQPHALPENKILLPSLLPIPVCARLSHGSVPRTLPARGWRSGGHTHSQPRPPACTIPERVRIGFGAY